MDKSENTFEGNIERFSGFAEIYDRFRPSPPTLLAFLLPRLADCVVPELVVDLGSGTGLSTRFWADRAKNVIGIEPTADMRGRAEADARPPNVSYRDGLSHATGLPDQCADIVTCSQSLHWMEPQATFEEVRRIARRGGVFAAFDYDWPPATGAWEADAAFDECLKQARVMERQLELKQAARQWPKDEHLARMQASGCFRYTRELVLHHTDDGNAERLVGLLLSQGGVMTLLKHGLSESELGIDRVREIARQKLGPEDALWVWSSRVRLGIV